MFSIQVTYRKKKVYITYDKNYFNDFDLINTNINVQNLPLLP